MDYPVNLILLQRLAKSFIVHEIAGYQLRSTNYCLAMTFVEAIVDDYLVSLLHKFFNDRAADITGSASDEYVHSYSFGFKSCVLRNYSDLHPSQCQLKPAWKRACG